MGAVAFTREPVAAAPSSESAWGGCSKAASLDQSQLLDGELPPNSSGVQHIQRLLVGCGRYGADRLPPRSVWNLEWNLVQNWDNDAERIIDWAMGLVPYSGRAVLFRFIE